MSGNLTILLIRVDRKRRAHSQVAAIDPMETIQQQRLRPNALMLSRFFTACKAEDRLPLPQHFSGNDLVTTLMS